MIKNERQYRITRARAEKFEHAMAELASAPDTPGVHPVLKKAQIGALRSQLGNLQAELDEYQALSADSGENERSIRRKMNTRSEGK